MFMNVFFYSLVLLTLSFTSFANGDLGSMFDLKGSQWRGQSRAPIVGRMKLHTGSPSRLTVHYTGAKKNPRVSLAQKLQNLFYFSTRETNSFKKNLWGDVPYHLYIDLNGKVAEGRGLGYQPDTNTNYNPDRHITVVVEGNDQDSISAEQKKSLFQVLDSALIHFGLTKQAIGIHKQYASTACPGPAVTAAVREYLKTQ